MKWSALRPGVVLPVATVLTMLALHLLAPIPVLALRNAAFDQFQRWWPRPAVEAPVAASAGALARSLEATERELLLEALKDPQSTRRLVAERLGISPRTLRYKLARLRAAGVSVPAA